MKKTTTCGLFGLKKVLATCLMTQEGVGASQQGRTAHFNWGYYERKLLDRHALCGGGKVVRISAYCVVVPPRATCQGWKRVILRFKSLLDDTPLQCYLEAWDSACGWWCWCWCITMLILLGKAG